MRLGHWFGICFTIIAVYKVFPLLPIDGLYPTGISMESRVILLTATAVPTILANAWLYIRLSKNQMWFAILCYFACVSIVELSIYAAGEYRPLYAFTPGVTVACLLDLLLWVKGKLSHKFSH